MRRAVMLALALLAAARTAHADELGVVSFNVWGVPTISPDRQARIDEIGRRLAALAQDEHDRVDVVALQELWVRDDATTIADHLERAGLSHHHHFMPEALDEDGSGLFVASRFPIDDIRFTAFDVGRTPHIPWHLDWMAKKGVGIVTITTPDGPVEIANTHMHANYQMGDYGFVQLAQGGQLASAVRDSGHPLILAGDLNVPPDALPARMVISGAGLTPASDHFGIDQIHGRAGGGQRLTTLATRWLWDHALRFDGGLTRTLSDHPCLLVRYRIEPCDGPCPAGPKRDESVARATAAQLELERSSAKRMIWLGRIAAAAAVVGAGLMLRMQRRRNGRRWLTVAAALMVVACASWAAYIGFHFGPDRLRQVESYARTLATPTQATKSGHR
jgi:endonuclease/exonuclease/phosphatase family metal-dependent hydrolase